MGINISKVTIPLELVIPQEFPLILLHAKDWFEFKDGKVTKTRLGTSYEVIQDGGEYQRFTVKCEDSESTIQESEIQISKEKVIVTFENALCKLYVDDRKQIQVSVKADDIVVM